jgi:molybdenum cofactor synthesis domain-containing protein
MNTAAVIIIGNEILSGRTRDANLPYLGRRLAELGIPLLEACVIPDDEPAIINTVNLYRKRFTYVFTTGGIGPTHDDITSASVAKAFNVPLEKNPQAVACLENYYEPGTINDARLKMAHIPAGATLIRNPVSAAPGFQIENVFVLPGVPEIMQAMFEGMTGRLAGGPPVLTRSIATNLRESALAEGLEKIQNLHPEVAIGSYPCFRMGGLGVNLVMRSIHAASINQVYEAVENLIQKLGGEANSAD